VPQQGAVGHAFFGPVGVPPGSTSGRARALLGAPREVVGQALSSARIRWGVRIAFATSSQYRTLPAEEGDLVSALTSRGVPVSGAVWDDPDVAWTDFDLVLLRNTWDYHERLEEFLAWIDRVAEATRLLNPASVVHWNSRKTYLEDLERAGVPVVPTERGSRLGSLRELLARPGWGRVVAKPAVSAGGANTHLLSADRPEEAERSFANLLGRGEVLLQPYLSSVEREGERSLLYLHGAFSHAVARASRFTAGTGPVDGAPVIPTAEELRVGAKAARQGPDPTLYARVDLVRDPRGEPRVLELEMIEPSLYLSGRPGLCERWARAIEVAARARRFPTG
jgi:glutathione synthase/RimK-type ligase-like ATP-grasp enzyme